MLTCLRPINSIRFTMIPSPYFYGPYSLSSRFIGLDGFCRRVIAYGFILMLASNNVTKYSACNILFYSLTNVLLLSNNNIKYHYSPVTMSIQEWVMNIKQLGQVDKFFSDKGFGFIKFNGRERIFFHSSNTLERLNDGDNVIFEVGDSKIMGGATEAFYVRKVYFEANGNPLALGKNFQAVPEAFELLLQYLREVRLDLHSGEQIVITKTFPHEVGAALAIETSAADDVFYAKLRGRKGYYRFVNGKQPVPSKKLTIVINFINSEEVYEISACYFGPKTPPAPFDRRATREAMDFWRTHALIPHEMFNINYNDVKNFYPDFFKSFEEIQGAA